MTRWLRPLRRPDVLLGWAHGVGGLALAVASAAVVGSGGRLTLFWLWPILAAFGGVMSLVTIVTDSRAWWEITAGCLTTAYLGRSIDIAVNYDQFGERAWLAITQWVVLGIVTLSSWLALGAAYPVLRRHGFRPHDRPT